MTKFNIAKILHDNRISRITADSREITENCAFFAVEGKNVDNNILDAITKRAKLIFTERQINKTQDRTQVVKIDDIEASMEEALNIIYPKIPKFLVAVTGTSGKTSIVSYIKQLFAFNGKASASIGSIGVQCSSVTVEALFNNDKLKILNTQSYHVFREILHILADNDIQYVAFEASSHGLDQKRLGSIKVDAAAFTNLTHDHLDYHGTVEKYLAAKLKLFSDHLKEKSLIVLNSEINGIQKHLSNIQAPAIFIGRGGDVELLKHKQSLNGQQAEFTVKNLNHVIQKENIILDINIIGSFQATNVLMACILVASAGIDLQRILALTPKLESVKGRLQKITNERDKFAVFIDHAHKPDPLEQTLRELNKLKKNGKLKIVFGCGGDRDRAKRGMMGNIAGRFADEVIITDDNPRSEDPALIRQSIIEGCKGQFYEIGDRAAAIKNAIKGLKNDDILLIAGKGHEDYQIIGTEKYPFDDAVAARKYINEEHK